MKYLAFSTPGNFTVQAPAGVPSGGADTVNNIIGLGIGLFITAGVLASLGFFIWGGLMWTSSGGDKQKVDKARKTILYAIIGLIIMVVSIAVVRIIGQMLGIQFFVVGS